MDGALVSGNCVFVCDKNTTYHHQNNPIIAELFRRDGIELSFLGVVVSNLNVATWPRACPSWRMSWGESPAW